MLKRIQRVFVVLLIIVSITLLFFFLNTNFSSPEDVREYVDGFGMFGPVVVIALIVLEVIIAPIPGYVIAIGSGYAFGPIYGTIYSYLGNVIGTLIAFVLARSFGRPLIKWVVKEDKIEFYDRFIKERGVYGLWVLYIFPVFPSDIISFATGLSNLKLRKFFPIVMLAYIPNMFLLNLFGDRLVYGLDRTNIILVTVFSLMMVSAFIYIFARKTRERGERIVGYAKEYAKGYAKDARDYAAGAKDYAKGALQNIKKKK